jgi:SAM-dependent methyltransferase
MNELPLEFDPDIYRSLHADLAKFSVSELRAHYDRFGLREGRRSHSIPDRSAFAALINTELALEIGPYAQPLLRGSHVKYADIYSTAALREMAPAMNLDPAGVPEIDWVVAPHDLGTIDEMFDAVLSSHAIEHQPNLVGHLRQVSRLLRPGGRYMLLVPDHRYCFDHFKTASTTVDVLDADARNVRLHDPRSLILSRLLITHNDAARHWSGDHGEPEHNPHFPDDDRIKLLRDALELLRTAPSALLNDHAWFFTPSSFRGIINDLTALELIDFRLERLYPTLRDTLEFWGVLRKRE